MARTSDATPQKKNEVSSVELPPGPAFYVVATPIGNLEDITLRALRVLNQVDLIYAEDTRTTAKILRHYEISTPLKSYRIHQETGDIERVLQGLRQNENLALCSEAGTPGISDPGANLIRTIRAECPEIPIIPIPGPSALASAISVSGFQSHPLLFLGFLSPRPGRRRKTLERYRDFEGTIVIYESVHRIQKLLLDVGEILPGRDLIIGREMTKLHEEYRLIRADIEPGTDPEPSGGPPGPIGDSPLTLKGEFTLILAPSGKKSFKKGEE